MRNADRSLTLNKSRNIRMILFCLPALLVYIIFFIGPMISNITYSFSNWNGFSRHIKWIGFRNYKNLISDNIFISSITHNIMYTAVVLIFQLGLALLFALILYKKIWGQNFFKTVFLMPVILSSITLTFIWSYMYDPMLGFINHFFDIIGCGFLKQSWLGDQRIALFSVAFVNIWQYVGYSMIIFIAGLNTIPESLFEAARIDGAGIWGTFRKVTLPLLAPSMTINIVLTTLGSFKVFDLIYLMTNGGPNNSTEVLATLVYRTGFTYGSMGYATAISTVMLLIIMIIGIIQTTILRSREITY